VHEKVVWMRTFGLVALAAGCSPEEGRYRAPQVLATSVDGGRAASPTADLWVELSAPVDAASVEGNVILVRGSPTEAVIDALSHGTSEDPRAGVVAVRTSVDGARVRLVPRRALAAEARYTLLIGPRLRAGDEPVGRLALRPFSSGRAEDGAPSIELVAPLDGATGVVRTLRAVEARLTPPVDAPELSLYDGETVVPTRPATDGQTIRLELEAPLEADRRYEVRAAPSVRDARGRPVFGDPPGFQTGAILRTVPPSLRALGVRPSDRCLVIGFDTDEETEAELCVGPRCAASGPARRHEVGLFIGDLDGPYAYRVRAWDETSLPPAEAEAPFDPPSMLPLAITEVLSVPRGARPAQQFVELYNLGLQPIDVGGLSFHDTAGADSLPSATLSPGGFALVVPADFVEDDGADPVPAPGTLLIRITDGRLGGDGIGAAGERLWVADAAGRIVTAWGPPPLSLTVGQSVVRRSPTACDLPSSFLPDPAQRATPGAF
jgi:hypothetical protein